MQSLHKVRTTFLFLFFCFLFTIVLFNSYRIQITKHAFFLDLAKQQYTCTITNFYPRATIFDRNGIPLALNKETVSAFVMPRTIKNKQLLITFLEKHFPAAAQRLQHNQHAHFMYIKRKLSDTEKTALENTTIKDIYFLREPSRYYPLESAGCLTGVTNIDNKGLFGIEFLYDQQLKGTPTTSHIEKDARSEKYYFSKHITTQGTPGTPLTLTIDAHLQFLVHEELRATIEKFEAQEGAVLVMDPETGDILALTSIPCFDPNAPINSQEATKNKAITESYEFGSILKTFCALAALEEGVVSYDEEIDCLNSKSALVDGRRVNNWEALGVVSFADVIKRSNNIGIAQIAKRLDTKLYEHYRMLGFGTKTGISFPGEQAGFVMPPERWSQQSIISLSYGYEITNTLLQIARAFCIFANDGHLITPRLILNKETPEPQKIYSSESIELMRTILEESTSAHATGRRAAVHGYKTLGKTSTTNLLKDGIYDPKKNMYGFAGIIEKDTYKRVIVCFVKEAARENLYASTVAAPLFEKIAERMLIHDKILN